MFCVDAVTDCLLVVVCFFVSHQAHTIELPTDEDTPTKRVDKIFELMDKVRSECFVALLKAQICMISFFQNRHTDIWYS